MCPVQPHVEATLNDLDRIPAEKAAFDDPRTPADARPRESVEVRTLAFF